ncbi:MAG: alkaline phosphatase [Bacteroidetes bacterium]|nr:alkaline phosphatase [Bacteroidota bacterium]
MKYILITILILGILSCASSNSSKKLSPETPSNIIFLIGDGMGLSAVSTSFYFGEEPSQFKRFKHIGLQKTSSASHKVTDSAASGTAMATGNKTYNGAIGVDTLKAPVQNITELTSLLGLSTGVVATSTISHATPATFYSHVEQRSMEEQIVVQLLDSEIDFFAGGGIDLFNNREDSIDLFPVAAEKGFIVDTTSLAAPGILQSGQKYGFLLANGGMPSATDNRGDFLQKATSLAIEQLSANQNGFFLMVEGSQIDWAEHENDAKRTVAEVLDFQEAIAAALDYAEEMGNTLVVVTADHETGGLSLSAKLNEETGGRDYKVVGPDFATTSHSATLIPVFAYGPGAEQFAGIYENTEIFHKMVGLVGLVGLE